MTVSIPQGARPAVSIAVVVPILALACAFPPFSTDMYLPAFHLLAETFQVENGAIEATLSAFFLGLAVGQGIYGPLIDRFGRRRPLLVGTGIFLAATLLCLITTDIVVFIVLRFVQALGACAGMIVGRAIVRDLFDERESARVLSLLMMVIILAPMTAPVLGGVIISHADWHAIFYFMLGLGLLSGLLVWGWLPETLPPERRRRVTMRGIVNVWGGLLRRPAFVLPAVSGGLAQATMFAYITGSPAVFVQQHGMSGQAYGFLFAVNAGGLVMSAQINRMALQRWSVRTVLGAGLVANMAASLLLVLMAGAENPFLLAVPLWVAIGSLGLIGANGAAAAMAASGVHGGSGSSLVGMMQFGFGFLVSSVVAVTQNGTAYPMVLGILCSGWAGGLLWWVVGKRVARRSKRSERSGG